MYTGYREVACSRGLTTPVTYLLRSLFQAKLETKALKAKRPGFTDERYNETSYYVEHVVQVNASFAELLARLTYIQKRGEKSVAFPSPAGTIVRHCWIERYVPYADVSSLSRVRLPFAITAVHGIRTNENNLCVTKNLSNFATAWLVLVHGSSCFILYLAEDKQRSCARYIKRQPKLDPVR
ncbi:hypothetical protein ALC57_07877 [Trachymyrmex cornetzi]|uniref:Uncharacterized protein n=1 Tax=Trachymyrmex cornetzi TaxID=471704 RepID=A0A195E422_9HYME|nr:hypothetical protein ALC57_07877 [Trachymyrmex cornetzi]